MENEIKCRVPFTSPSPYHTSEILRSYYEETESSANSFVLVEKLNKLVALNDYIQNKGECANKKRLLNLLMAWNFTFSLFTYFMSLLFLLESSRSSGVGPVVCKPHIIAL